MKKQERKKYEEFKSKVKNITLYLLENMFDSLEDLGELSLSRQAAYQIFYQNKSYEWRASVFGKWLQNLKQRDLIKIQKSEKGDSIILTNKAKMKLVEKIVASKKPDKCYRFLAFDVPESLCNKRDKFRLLIKRMGFVQIQKSLWVIDIDVTDLIEVAVYECEIERYVAYIISSKTDIDGVIEKKFVENRAKLRRK